MLVLSALTGLLIVGTMPAPPHVNKLSLMPAAPEISITSSGTGKRLKLDGNRGFIPGSSNKLNSYIIGDDI
jgi:hypothetical protein